MNIRVRQRITQLKELLSILREPEAWRALVSWRPFSITAFKMMRSLKSLVPDLRTIVDVGANEGQFSRAAAETFPDARIFSFEALPDVSDTLRRNLSDAANVHVEPQAVGSEDGRLSFHRYDYSLQASPLRKLPDRSGSSASDRRNDQTIDVPVARLDTVLSPDDLTAPCLLKLDVQGFELEVLRGAGELLPAFDYVLVEASFREMYEDQPLFDDIYVYVTSRDFRLLAPIDVLTDSSGVVTQVDALFQKS